MKQTTSSAIAAATAVLSLVLAGASRAEPSDEDGFSKPDQGALASTTHAAGRILTQPVRDVGLMRDQAPEVLARASKDPYALPSDHDCHALGQEIDALNGFLGPDLAPAARENRAGKLAEAGGRAVVNSVIPFRNIVREVTGAAPAQRRLQQAVELGYARRGFLRGMSQTWGCSTMSVAAVDPDL